MTRTHAFDDTPGWELLDRYQADEATPEERATVVAYLAARPVMASALGAVAHMLRHPRTVPSGVAAMLAAAHERIARRASLRQLAAGRAAGRLEYAMAALLDATDVRLSADEVDELRRLIEAAREAGR